MLEFWRFVLCFRTIPEGVFASVSVSIDLRLMFISAARDWFKQGIEPQYFFN